MVLNIFFVDHIIQNNKYRQMPTFIEFIEAPQAYVLETVLNQNPEYIQKLIDYLTIPQNILLSNERQCYLYPSKASEILANGVAYRVLIQKKEVNQEQKYVYLERLINNLNREQGEPTLLGYCCKVLISLVKKTPQIYQFIKDSQNLFLLLLKDDKKIQSLRQFISLLLIESTMELYVFLKGMLIRSIIYRIVEDENVGASIYRCIDYFYDNILKGLEDVAEDQKPQLLEVCKNFEDQHFITLVILKIQADNSHRNTHIGSFLCKAISRNQEVCQLVALHIDTVADFLEEYEESSIFMEYVRAEHINLLKIFVQLLRQQRLKEQLTVQLIKRLLVYSNVHNNNTLVHNLLMKTINYLHEQEKSNILEELNIISFFCKSQTPQNFGFMSLRRRVFNFWFDHHLLQNLSQDQLSLIESQCNKRKKQIDESLYFNECKTHPSSNDFSSTKVPSQLSILTQMPG